MSEPTPGTEVEQPESGPVKAAQIEPDLPPPPKKGFFNRLYDRETRLGRGMRSFTRGLGLVVGLFALGLMTAYILFFQPVERRYRAAQAELTQANAALEMLQSDLRLSQTSLAGSETQRKTAAAELSQAQARLGVQQARVRVLEVRLALAQKDTAGARLALGELEKTLTALKPALSAASGQTLDQVLALVKGDIGRGADLADQDLQRLMSELELIDQSLN